MSLEAVGIGDLHLTDSAGQGGLAKYVENPNTYVMSEVSRVVRWALERHIKEVWFYGDFCEHPRMSYEGIKAFAKLIRRYPEVTFRGVLGNHDKISLNSAEGHSMEIIKDYKLPNFVLYEKDTIETIDGVPVKFLPWPSCKVDKKCLNVIHTEVKGSKLDSGRVMNGDTLPSSSAVTVAGHLHTMHKVRNTYYSGTLYQTNFGEQLDKYFHHITFSNPDDYEIINVPFDQKYKLYNCVIETEADIKKLPKGDTNLLKVVVKDGVDVIVPDMPNIVIAKAFKTRAELQTILTEDLVDGKELVIKSEDFFKSWLSNRGVPDSLMSRTRKLRKEILDGSK